MGERAFIVPIVLGSVPEFSNNEAYGAIQNGVTWTWNGTLAHTTVWHASQHAVAITPLERVVVESLKVRDDPSLTAMEGQRPVGVWVANYASADVTIVGADVQGALVGILSPFFYGQASESSTGGSLTVEKSYFRTGIGISIATAYTDEARAGVQTKQAVVRRAVFESLTRNKTRLQEWQAISMNFGMIPRDPQPRAPLLVYDFNGQAGKNFKVYYSLEASPATAPCHDTMPAIGGWVCRME